MKDSFIFYNSFYYALKELPPEDKSLVLDAICEYALLDKPIDLEKLAPTAKIALILIEPQLKANNKRYEDGFKGGAPKGNQNAKKKQPNNHRLKPKQPNDNENDNVNEEERTAVVFVLNEKGITIDCPLVHTEKEYIKLLAALDKQPWAKERYRHLSKLHKFWKEIMTAQYNDYSKKATEPSGNGIIPHDFNADEWNAIFDKNNEDLI